MKTQSIRQRLADRLRGLKPQQPNTQMMVAAGWLVTISEDKAKECCLKELQDVKAHTKTNLSARWAGWWKKNTTRQLRQRKKSFSMRCPA